ncbi:hypothetical protein EDD85DRAFT_826817 [Armillaria nabsnona]|nr:hypothetical protein EDD85DRAFT_826817 [Armillaria nabsnona]
MKMLVVRLKVAVKLRNVAVLKLKVAVKRKLLSMNHRLVSVSFRGGWKILSTSIVLLMWQSSRLVLFSFFARLIVAIIAFVLSIAIDLAVVFNCFPSTILLCCMLVTN